MNTDTFTAVVAETPEPTLRVVDMNRGVVLTTSRLGYLDNEPGNWTIRLRARGYQIVEGCVWEENEAGLMTTAVVRRSPERYRVLLACGDTVFTEMPPLGHAYPCNDHMGHQRVFRVLDTVAMTIGDR